MAAAWARVVVGLDGSTNARRAARFLLRLRPPRGARATLVRVVEPMNPPSVALLPVGVRSRLMAEAAALLASRVRVAERDVQGAARLLARAGWRTRTVVRVGQPLAELLGAVRASRAGLLVLGARGVGGVARLLLGSVAEGAVRRAPVSVLIVK
jgi:nucleotide-binding universal stress UspA family protein